MKTKFSEYYEKRNYINSLLESVVLEAQNNPELNEVLTEAGFWNNLVNAGKEVWKGVTNTGAAVVNQFTGPASQYTNAISALQKAAAQLEKDPNWSKSTTTGASGKFPAMNLIDWLKSVIMELQSQQPQFANKQQSTNMTSTANPAPGVPVSNNPRTVGS